MLKKNPNVWYRFLGAFGYWCPALLVLGPERLPGAMRSTINTIRSVRNVATGFKQEVEHQLQYMNYENLKKAEQQGLKDLSPELEQSVDELKKAAESVQEPYKKQ